MEEDNGGDIEKWLFKESTKLDISGKVKFAHEDTHTKWWQARLRGNLLGLKPLDFASEPLVIVCEKIQVERSECQEKSLVIKQCNKEVLLTFESDEELEKWMLKLMTCSHRIIQAEYEQALYKRFTQPLPAISSVHFVDYFLTSPFSREQVFSLSQTLNFPTRQIKCRETMYETRLSLLIPQEMLRHSLKWASELRDELLEKLWGVKNGVILEALHTAVRHLNSNIEICTQASEFLDTYAGPSFRPSTEKYRVSFLFVPTNLHVQSFHINDKLSAAFLTVGALAALPLRFSSGGLYKIRNKFSTGLGPIALDHSDETRFRTRQQTLIKMKRKIGELSREIDGKTTDRLGMELFEEIKMMYEQITDMVNSFPNIANLVDSLCEGGLAMKQHKSDEAVPRDTLRNQLDFLQAQFVSLDSKMAANDRRMEGKEGREKEKVNDEHTIRAAIHSAVHSTLDALHHLASSLLSAQMLSLVQCLRKPSDCQTFFHIQLRHDVLLCHAVTLVTCALLTALYNSPIDISIHWSHSPPLITYFAFLSCYGDEHGMLEDTMEAWHLFRSSASFRFIKISSSVSRNCIPQIEGFRTELRISIPIHPEKMDKLPPHLSNGDWFRPRVTFWNVGVNHEASLAASIGDLSLEEEINRTALRHTVEHTLLLNSSGENAGAGGLVDQLLADLQQTVSACPSRKNLAIFTQAMALNAAIGGVPVISCKSGKDRTSMGVTMDEGRILKETCGISNQQMQEMMECLRKNGVRRENCRKNVGRPLYSFSPFQMNFLPPYMRPPFGTYSNMVSS